MVQAPPARRAALWRSPAPVYLGTSKRHLPRQHPIVRLRTYFEPLAALERVPVQRLARGHARGNIAVLDKCNVAPPRHGAHLVEAGIPAASEYMRAARADTYGPNSASSWSRVMLLGSCCRNRILFGGTYSSGSCVAC